VKGLAAKDEAKEASKKKIACMLSEGQIRDCDLRPFFLSLQAFVNALSLYRSS